jgi:SAM-dependent methyltransferase
MTKRRIERPSVSDGYDRWSATYDATPNPLVALDRRVTLRALDARRGERVLDAGCGTGAYLAALCRAGARAVGLDFSPGMLRVARRAAPAAGLARADLDQDLPVRRAVFDVVLSALVSEHLNDLQRFFTEAFCALRRGGRLVFSAFHPELAHSGIEANFEHEGTEYRLGAHRYTVAEYLSHIADAGFRNVDWREYHGDEQLVEEMPSATKYFARPLLLLVRAERAV